MPRQASPEPESIKSSLGLQRRIMLYVGISLVLLFGGYFIIGVGTVNRSTDMVFGERLTIAKSVAAALSQEFDHAVNDAVEDLDTFTSTSDQATSLSVVSEIYLHLSQVDVLTFFDVKRVNLVSESGELISAAPPWPHDRNPQMFSRLPTESLIFDRYLQFFWAESESGDGFLSFSQQVQDANGNLLAHLIFEMSPVDSSISFFPFGNPDISTRSDLGTQDFPEQAEYYLEIMTIGGLTVGGIGRSLSPGQKSPHYELVAPTIDDRAANVVLHDVSRVSEARDHVVAIVPVPQTNLYLLLEQDIDVALALPNEFMSRLILYGVIGFIVAMIAAWFTTRRVVLPTEHLTQAAVRMAHGELSTPIEVGAQDEIGVLASNLELMRRQLNDAVERVSTANRELESRVTERTRQLQQLVRRVLTAQEEERNRVALELHDETAQIISTITFTLSSVVRKESGLSAEDASRLRETRDLSGRLLEGIRRLISALRPAALTEIGLGPALRSHAGDLFNMAEVEIHIVDHTMGSYIPDYVELIFYRVGQEALNNVAKHANCSDVWVKVSKTETKITMTIRDNGVGFDVDDVLDGDGRGVGLIGMRERAGLIDGKVKIDSSPGMGSTVEIQVSIEDDD